MLKKISIFKLNKKVKYQNFYEELFLTDAEGSLAEKEFKLYEYGFWHFHPHKILC